MKWQGIDLDLLASLGSSAATALTEAGAKPPPKVNGLMGLWRASRDPEIQKGLGFFLNFLKRWGAKLA